MQNHRFFSRLRATGIASLAACALLGAGAAHGAAASKIASKMASKVASKGHRNVKAAHHAQLKRRKVLQTGIASYYARSFEGRRTASGERYDMHKLTAAHRTLPLGSRVRVSSVSRAKSVVVRINDRGPFEKGRVIDLSYAAAQALGLSHSGTGRVVIETVR